MFALGRNKIGDIVVKGIVLVGDIVVAILCKVRGWYCYRDDIVVEAVLVIRTVRYINYGELKV